MDIGNVQTTDQLDAVLRFVYGIFPEKANGESRYSRAFWAGKLQESPNLLLWARDGDTVCGSVFGFVENDAVTMGHCAVASPYRHRGIGRALVKELEARARGLRWRRITLGAVEGAEGFYEKLGYSGSLLVQSEEHTVDELRAFNTKYDVIGTSVWNGTVSQVWLQLPRIDREFQREYERSLPGCHTQMAFGKDLRAPSPNACAEGHAPAGRTVSNDEEP